MASDFWFKFYFKDWADDVKMLSLSARGLLIELIIHLRKTNGEMIVDIGLISRLSGGLSEEIKFALLEFKQYNIFDFENREGVEYLISRKIVKEIHKSLVNTENGKKGGNPKLKKSDNQTVKRKANRVSNSIFNSISNNIYGVNKNIILSEEEFEKLKQDFPNLYLKAIDYLSNWGLEKPSKFKEYKSHNLTIRRWVIDAVTDKKEETKKAVVMPFPKTENFRNK